jgi:HEPN domain-containing protein
MNRDDLKTLANLRLAEARALLAAGHPSGAYYLAGYAVECALKAVIARLTQQYDFPDKQRALDSFVHDLEKLSRTAKLAGPLDAAIQSNPMLGQHWDKVIGWSESSRYETYDQAIAQDMLDAVGDELSGVLPWIMRYW